MKTKKIIKNIFIFLLALILIAAVYIGFTVNKSKPKIEGSINIENIKDEVIVNRNKNGIPTIEAKNYLDLITAQGYVQAQDRLFQMDFARRQASGKLSEVVGEAAIENDKKFLTFSLRKAAEKSYPSYSKEAQEVLLAFSNGVNAYIKEAISENKLPYEFTLLGYEPEPWSEIDSLSIGKYMAYDLAGHLDNQAFNSWVINNLGKNYLAEMYPDSNADKLSEDLININSESAINIDSKLANIKFPDKENGSNNWAVSGSKTKSGKALISDDPHLSLGLPSIWYQMQLKSPEMNVSGVIFAGIPGIILGNNDDIAWAVTNVGPDVQDIYIETVNPDNKYQFKYNNQWYDAEVDKYQIKIKGKDDEEFEVVNSKHGPIMNEILEPVNTNKQFAMRWTALDATNELEAILMINKAKNWNEFEKALESFKSPAQNFIYADNEGNIGFKANGLIPIRKNGNGLVPVPGDTDKYEWTGFIPFDKLPKEFNPERGYVASANTKTIADYEPHISNVWAQPYRYNRINEVLDNKNNLTVEDMKNLQMDKLNLYAREFLPYLLENTSNIPEDIMESLKNWKYVDDKDLLAPLIFDKWMSKIYETLMRNFMDEEVYEFMPSKHFVGDNILRQYMNDEKSIFIENYGGIEKLLSDSFSNTINELKETNGDNPSSWKWGDNHKSAFLHPLGRSSKILGMILNTKEIPMGGSKVTVQAARQNENGLINHGASWRYVYDFNTKDGYHIVAPGQSGHFLSKYYKDQAKNWVDGTYLKINLNNYDVEHKLKLVPKNQ